jgi:hypothetical protein
VRSALVTAICLIATACSATAPVSRPVASGFAIEAGVVDPYGDGKQHLATGRYQLAVERFGQALARDGRSLDALNGLAIAYSRLGRFDVAQTYFERALQIDATSATTLNNYGWSLAEQGRLREAKRFLELALRQAELTDAPLVTGNIERIRHARPSALVAALEDDGMSEPHLDSHRLMRVDHNAYRLETIATPATLPEPPTAPHGTQPPGEPRYHPTAISAEKRRSGPDGSFAPAVVTEGGAGQAPASAKRLRDAEPEPDIPINPPSGVVPIQLWPEPASEPEAATVQAGEKT